MKKIILKISAFLASALMLLNFFPMAAGSAELNKVMGNTDRPITFYVRSDGQAVIILCQDKGTCYEESLTNMFSGIVGEADQWGKYHIYYEVNGLHFKEEWKRTYLNSTYHLVLQNAGLYKITIVPYTADEMTKSYWTRTFYRWKNVPIWWVEDTLRCTVYHDQI